MHENTAPVILVQQYLEVGAHSRVVTDARAASWRPLHDHRQLPKLLRELEPQLITGFLRCFLAAAVEALSTTCCATPTFCRQSGFRYPPQEIPSRCRFKRERGPYRDEIGQGSGMISTEGSIDSGATYLGCFLRAYRRPCAHGGFGPEPG